jgi:hypothetical protein
MVAGAPRTTNEHAERGTAGHEAGEFCIKVGCSAYVSSVAPDMFGTADCIYIAGRTLYVDDYKNGRGIVEATCSQLAYYAVATLDTFQLWCAVDQVVVGIVQPNANHVNGPIRQITYTIAQLREWQARFELASIAARQPNAPCTAGKHCRYCPAVGCRARIMWTIETAGVDAPVDTLSAAECAVVMACLPELKDSLEAVKSHALALMRQGARIDGFKPVRAVKHAVCSDEGAFIAAAQSAGVDPSKLRNPGKLIGATAAKKLVGAKLVDEHYRKPEAGIVLAPINDSRPPVNVGSAAGIFKPITEAM